MPVEYLQQEPIFASYLDRLRSTLPGELVLFSTEKGPVIGIKVEVKLDSEIRQFLFEFGYAIPNNIETVQFISLKPEESIEDKSQRVLTNNSLYDPALSGLVSNGRLVSPKRTIMLTLLRVFGNSSLAKEYFCKSIDKDPNKKILKIYKGHGGGKPFTIGEESMSNSAWLYDDPQNGQRLVDLRTLEQIMQTKNVAEIESRGATRLQAPGNHISVQELLNIDDFVDSEVGGIVLDACNTEEDEVRTKNFPIAYVLGISRGGGGTDEHPRLPVVWNPSAPTTEVFEDRKSDI